MPGPVYTGGSHLEDKMFLFSSKLISECVCRLCVHLCMCMCSPLAPFKLDSLSNRRIWASILDEQRSHPAIERVHKSVGLCETEDKGLCVEGVHKCISPSEIKGKEMCIFTSKLQSLSVREDQDLAVCTFV